MNHDTWQVLRDAWQILRRALILLATVVMLRAQPVVHNDDAFDGLIVAEAALERTVKELAQPAGR